MLSVTDRRNKLHFSFRPPGIAARAEQGVGNSHLPVRATAFYRAYRRNNRDRAFNAVG